MPCRSLQGGGGACGRRPHSRSPRRLHEVMLLMRQRSKTAVVARERGAQGIGVTLSSAQAAACRSHGLDVHVRDMRDVTRADFGGFDAVASLGAFEHVASVADYEAGGHGRHIRQVRAMAAYQPQAPADPPPTVVLWGVHDSAVPLEDHVELALRCRGAVVPIEDAAHVPFFEQPAAVVRCPSRRAAGPTPPCGRPPRADAGRSSRLTPPATPRRNPCTPSSKRKAATPGCACADRGTRGS